jgi:hypothetical protein
MRDRNGVWLNGASTISALLYGDGDFVQTVRAAFNFGWDADNNAAASGAILGVLKGSKWLWSQGWDIKDKFRNTSRDEMPEDETITSYGDRLIALAEANITQHGGSKTIANGRPAYRIRFENAANVEPLRDLAKQHDALRDQLRGEIERAVAAGASSREKARAAYLAICLDFAFEMKQKHPPQWAQAIDALAGYPRVLAVIFFESPIPAGESIRQKALSAGLQKPAQRLRLWA